VAHRRPKRRIGGRRGWGGSWIDFLLQGGGLHQSGPTVFVTSQAAWDGGLGGKKREGERTGAAVRKEFSKGRAGPVNGIPTNIGCPVDARWGG